MTRSDPRLCRPVVVRLRGEVDMADCRGLDRRLRAASRYLVVDLSDVSLLSAAAIGVLIAHAERLSAAGGWLWVVAGSGSVRRVLRLTRADEVLDCYDSITDLPAPAGLAAVESVEVSLGEAAAVRRKARSRPVIAQALELVRDRYGLPDQDAAFELVRECSQRHNLRVHRLATAILAAPAPRPGAASWFPGRARRPAPRLTFPTATGNGRSGVLDALLREAAACVGTEAADLLLAEGERLRVDRHRGLTTEVVAVLGQPGYTGGVPGVAQRSRRRVVADVATDPLFPDLGVRLVLLDGGSRALHSSPLPGTSGRSLGVVSIHHPRRGRVPTPAEHARLDELTRQGGAWLEWYQRTIVLDALEHLHHAARAYRSAGSDA